MVFSVTIFFFMINYNSQKILLLVLLLHFSLDYLCSMKKLYPFLLYFYFVFVHVISPSSFMLSMFFIEFDIFFYLFQTISSVHLACFEF